MRVLHVENSTGRGGSLKSLRQLGPTPEGVTARILSLVRPWDKAAIPDCVLPSNNLLGAWRLLQREKPDVVHVNNAPIEAWGLVLAAAWEGIPVVSHLRSVRPLRRLERLMQGCLDAIVLLSEFHKASLQATPIVKVVHHPMEDPGSHPLPAEPIVGIFSILKPDKGHELALRALALVRVPWKLWVVGEALPDQPSTQKTLEALIAKLGLSSRVEFLGRTDNPMKHMKGCRLIIDPSSKAEGFRRTVAEACLLGRPVLASDTGGEADLLPTDQLLPHLNEEAWALALERFLSDAPMASRRGNEARQRALHLLSPSNKGRFWALMLSVAGKGI